MTVVQSFPPSIGPAPRALVLGSMPGAASLAAGRYYAHPRNLFWPIMGELFGAGPTLDYEARLAALHRHGVGLWDVLASCERPGSLDQRIVRGSERANAIATLVAAQPRLATIAFNGAAAAAAFARHVAPSIAPERRAALTLLPLPSTSPANAAQPHAAKLARWRALADALR